MAFMAIRVRLRNREAAFSSEGRRNKSGGKILLPGSFGALVAKGLCLVLCISAVVYLLTPTEQIIIPDQWVNINQADFITKRGVLYLHQKPFSGRQYALSVGGDTLLRVSYWQGKRHDRAETWYAHGQLKENRYYESGKQIGKHEGWWSDGKPKFVYHFEADVYEGSCREWYENGRLSHLGHYHQGQEEGRHTFWRTDGSLYANYVAKGGRNYGLTGVKNCKSLKNPKGE
jgi:hypothetical protein